MTTFFVVTAIVIIIIGLGKGGLGGTLGVLATPLMTLVLPAHKVIGLLLPIIIIADVFAVVSHWQRWDRRLVLILMPGSIIGIGFATLLIARITPEVLRHGIGIITFLFVLYKLFEDHISQFGRYNLRNWHGWAAGGIAGFASTLAHTGGPPIAIYLLMQNISPRVFVATSALFFTALNWIKVPSYFYLGLFDFRLLWQVAWLLPLLPFSVWVGKQIAVKIDKTIFDRIIIVFLTITALYLLFG